MHATATRPLGISCSVILFVAMWALLGSPTAAVAAEFNIADGDVPGLIDAINTANANGEADVINLAVGGTYTMTAVDNDTDGANGLPSVTSEITINGNGATIKRSSAGGTPPFRVFHLAASADLAVNDLTVSYGFAQGDFLRKNGGGILNIGTGMVTLTHCTVTRNTAGGDGGGICNSSGTVTLINSTVSRNSAGSGGGIHNLGRMTLTNGSTVSLNTAEWTGGGIDNAGTLTLTNSSVRENGAPYRLGGGIANSGRLTVTNSTVSGNTAGWGGAMINAGTLTLTNCTVSGNWTEWTGGIDNNSGTATVTNCTVGENRGDGIYNSFGTVTLSNTIVANSTGGDCYNHGGTVNDDGYNIVEDGSCISHPTSMSGDPLLGPLADNGGPTKTHALLPGSMAIDAGDCAGGTVTQDQRGVPRPQDAGCDIGAVELIDCNDNGIDDGAEIAAGTSGDCNDNGIPDECDIGAGTSADNNGNGIPDECECDDCPPGSVPIVDLQGDFAGWCLSTSHPGKVDVFVDAVIPGELVVMELTKEFWDLEPILIDFSQVCPDELTAHTIYIGDESLRNLSGVDWADFHWIVLNHLDTWFDVAASAGFETSPLVDKTFLDPDDEFEDPNKATVVVASGGAVLYGTSYFAGSGTGELVIGVDLSSELPVAFGLEERPTTEGVVDLTVGSNANGVTISVGPADVYECGSGQPNFTRYYLPDTEATLTAPAAFGGKRFAGWKLNGETQSGGDRTIDVTVSDSMDAEAVYRPAVINGQPVHSLER